MSKSVLAKIYWVPPEEGGRTSLPTGKTYTTLSRFPEDLGAWLREAWSIVLEFDAPLQRRATPLWLEHGFWRRKRLLTDCNLVVLLSCTKAKRKWRR